MRICFLVLCFSLGEKVIAQQESPQYSIGFEIGYATASGNFHIGTHAFYGAYLERVVSARVHLTFGAEYFQNVTNGVWASLEHRGTLYTAITPYIWRNFAVRIGVKYSVFDWLRIGGGVSGDMITTRRVTYAYQNPFVIDYPNENVSLEGESSRMEYFLRPSVYLDFDFPYRLTQRVSMYLGGELSLTFLGCSLSENNQLIAGVYGASLGLMYEIK